MERENKNISGFLSINRYPNLTYFKSIIPTWWNHKKLYAINRLGGSTPLAPLLGRASVTRRVADRRPDVSPSFPRVVSGKPCSQTTRPQPRGPGAASKPAGRGRMYRRSVGRTRRLGNFRPGTVSLRQQPSPPPTPVRRDRPTTAAAVPSRTHTSDGGRAWRSDPTRRCPSGSCFGAVPPGVRTTPRRFLERGVVCDVRCRRVCECGGHRGAENNIITHGVRMVANFSR